MKSFQIKDANVLKLCISYLRILNFLPALGKGITDKRFLIGLFCSFLITTIPLIGCTTHLVEAFYFGNNYIMHDVIDDFTLMITAICNYWIMITFLINQNKIFELIIDVSDFHVFPKPGDFDKTDDLMNKLTKFYITYVAVGVAGYATLQMALRNDCEEENVQYDVHRVCGLMFPLVLPEHFLRFPYYHFIELGQIISAYFVMSSMITIVCSMLGIAELLNRHIAHLKQLLGASMDSDNEHKRRQQLNFCVRYHIHIIKLNEQLNHAYGSIVFILAMFSGVVLAMILYLYIHEPRPQILIVAGGWLMLLFVLSIFGQRMIDESSGIPISIYSTNWYDADYTTQKHLMLIIARGSQPLTMDALGFGTLSLETFIATMNLTYSVVTLLKSQQMENV